MTFNDLNTSSHPDQSRFHNQHACMWINPHPIHVLRLAPIPRGPIPYQYPNPFLSEPCLLVSLSYGAVRKTRVPRQVRYPNLILTMLTDWLACLRGAASKYLPQAEVGIISYHIKNLKSVPNQVQTALFNQIKCSVMTRSPSCRQCKLTAHTVVFIRIRHAHHLYQINIFELPNSRISVDSNQGGYYYPYLRYYDLHLEEKKVFFPYIESKVTNSQPLWTAWHDSFPSSHAYPKTPTWR